MVHTKEHDGDNEALEPKCQLLRRNGTPTALRSWFYSPYSIYHIKSLFSHSMKPSLRSF